MVNLKEQFGERFKITYDLGMRHDPWMMQIPCKKGIIYSHGRDTLGLECKTHTARQVLLISGIKIHQQGDSEWTLLFSIEQFEQVAAIVEPKKRRKLSDSQKERLKKYWFVKQ